MVAHKNAERLRPSRPNLDFRSGISDERDLCQISEGDARAACP